MFLGFPFLISVHFQNIATLKFFECLDIMWGFYLTNLLSPIILGKIGQYSKVDVTSWKLLNVNGISWNFGDIISLVWRNAIVLVRYYLGFRDLKCTLPAGTTVHFTQLKTHNFQNCIWFIFGIGLERLLHIPSDWYFYNYW